MFHLTPETFLYDIIQ